MAYSIGYGPQRNDRCKKRSGKRFKVLALVFFLVFLLSVQLFSQEGAEFLRRMILPVGEDSVEAFSAMIQAVEDGEPMNEVTLTGLLCREPTFRRTPLGREICDAMLAVPRAFRRADYLPCILWGRTAQEISRCSLRDAIALHGRLQSRVYTKYLDGSWVMPSGSTPNTWTASPRSGPPMRSPPSPPPR